MSLDQRTVLDLADAGYGRSPSRLERVLYAPAACDWIVAGYFFTVIVGLSRARVSAARDIYLVFTFSILAAYLACVYLYRFRFEAILRTGARVGYFVRLAYHLLPLVAVLVFYLNLRPILPLLNEALFDEKLYRLDLRIFGFEPTLAVEGLSTRGVVEWFSFFYYSYFFLMGSFIFVMICTVEDDGRLSHFAAGMLSVVCVGHFIYALVPGFGPYEHLAHEYRSPLAGGTFYDLILEAVAGAGPLRDIFPSLHTALPTFCALFAWRHYPRYAPIVTFFAGNIMAATIVLRWHYAVDVFAGLVLAVAAFVLAPKLVESYQARRAEVGLAALRRW